MGMARRCDMYWSWLESITYQLTVMSKKEADVNLADSICLLKSEGSKVYEFCAREATQIFGGNALYVNGAGRRIEPAVMQVKAYQIPAGAEDVMDSFAGKTIFR